MDKSFDKSWLSPCGICYETYDEKERTPKVLDCGHTFCVMCIKTLQRANSFTFNCPICGCQIRMLDENRLMRSSSERPCSSCGDPPRSMRFCTTCSEMKENKPAVYICGNCVLERHDGHTLLKLDQRDEKLQKARLMLERCKEEEMACVDFLCDIFELAKEEWKKKFPENTKKAFELLEDTFLDEDMDAVVNGVKSKLACIKLELNGIITKLLPEADGHTLHQRVQKLAKKADAAGDGCTRAKWWRHAAQLFRSSFSVDNYMDAVRAQWQLVHELFDKFQGGEKHIQDELKRCAIEGIVLCTKAIEDHPTEAEHNLRMIRNKGDFAAWIGQMYPRGSTDYHKYINEATGFYETACRCSREVVAYTEARLVLMYNFALHQKHELRNIPRANELIHQALTEAREALEKNKKHKLTDRERELIDRIKNCGSVQAASAWVEPDWEMAKDEEEDEEWGNRAYSSGDEY